MQRLRPEPKIEQLSEDDFYLFCDSNTIFHVKGVYCILQNGEYFCAKYVENQVIKRIFRDKEDVEKWITGELRDPRIVFVNQEVNKVTRENLYTTK